MTRHGEHIYLSNILKLGDIMLFNNVEIEETFAEAFPMYATRILITAKNEKWTLIAARVATGFASSIIMSPAEAGIEAKVPETATPDGRYGCLIQIYHRSIPELKFQVLARIGQCILTCPTTSVFDGLRRVKRKMRIGDAIGKFGDGFQYMEERDGMKLWHIPVMEGEFIIEDTLGVVKSVAGGNLIILAKDGDSGLKAAEHAVSSIRRYCRNVILPFPGGIVRSGSKVGSLKYPKLAATTNHLLCPTLREKVKDSLVPANVNCVYEIVINGLRFDDVLKAMRVGILAATEIEGVVKITATNFGGKLGPYKLYTTDAIERVKELARRD